MGEHDKEKKESTRLKVFARVRPAFEGEFDKGAYNVLELRDDKKGISLRDRTYEFDEVFPGGTEQEEIFNKVAKPTIDNAFEGFTGTVFVYGQTGTGKTHTMSNRAAETRHQGIIPRAISYLFERISNDASHTYSLTMQYLQLYRDNLQDLQSPDTPFLKLENSPDGGTRINGVSTSPPITSVDHFFEVYDAADANRVVAETMMNKQSSRGHSVLTLFLKRESEGNLIPALNGKLVFVDLAGYERIKKTMITDEIRKHEAQAINLSLSALATCIAAITAKATHIPFRNSRLTRILYDSLVGNSVTSVIITMGPSSFHTTETVNTLYFGHNAIQCKTSVQRDTGPVNWQKEALQWKQRATGLSSQVTQLETENTLLLDKLANFDGSGDNGALSSVTAVSQRDLSRLKSGIKDNQGLEKLLEELEKTKLELAESSVLVRNAEEETEEARVATEEMSWLLEQERSRVVNTEASEIELNRQVELLRQQLAVVTEQLDIADTQLSQLVPQEEFSPTSIPSITITGTIHERAHEKGVSIKPVYIAYDTDKYLMWSDLVESELKRDEVKATEHDRSHWYVSVPHMARFVADDRRELKAPYMQYRSPERTHSAQSPARETHGKVRIEGSPHVMSTLACVVDTTVLPDTHEVAWEASDNGFDFRALPLATEATFYVTGSLVHKYIRACVKWMDKRQYSSLVFVNIPQELDDQLQQFVLQGGALFEVERDKVKTSLAVECGGHIIVTNEDEVGFDVSTVSLRAAGGEGAILVGGGREAQVVAKSQRDRELILLTVKLFKVLRTGHIAEWMLGDAARQWLDGSWLRGKDIADRMTLQPRLRAASKSGHWSSGIQSPTKRAGGKSTFMYRAEELLDPPSVGVVVPAPSTSITGITTAPPSPFKKDTVLLEQKQSFHSPCSTNVASNVASLASPVFSPSSMTLGQQRGTPVSTSRHVRRGNIYQVPQNSVGPRKMSMMQQKRNSVPLSAITLKANDYLTANEVCSVGSSDDTQIVTQQRQSTRSVQIAHDVEIFNKSQ